MPRQNRVTPFGEIIVTSARGTLMGNRGGCLHDEQGRLTGRRWIGKRWIICLLQFKGRNREVMTPGLYTELFFLDEATALAAGHRPCGECRREDHENFKRIWLAANRGIAPAGVAIEEIDEQLHAERVHRDKTKVTYRSRLAEVPNGAFVTAPGQPEVALLRWRGRLYPWSPGGYGRGAPVGNDLVVTVLTPRSTAVALGAGYTPNVALS